MKKIWLMVVPLVLILSSCPQENLPVDREVGTLILDLSGSGLKGLTIIPPLEMNVAYYDVQGVGPFSATFSQNEVTGLTVVQNALITGTWTVTVDAFNSSRIAIGQGITSVTIAAGATVQASVQVVPLSGTGTLVVTISWPAGAITTPVVSGTLTAAGGTPVAMTFILGTDTASYSANALAAGYYSMTLQLSNGVTVEWGLLEAVRILKDQTTSASFALTLQDLISGG